jgi:hypothetical protein
VATAPAARLPRSSGLLARYQYLQAGPGERVRRAAAVVQQLVSLAPSRHAHGRGPRARLLAQPASLLTWHVL